MVRLILTDMDGTLLDSQSRLPKGFDAMVATLKARGVMFGAASGRQYYSLIESFAAYKDEFLFVAENGTNVRYRGEQVFSCPMDRDVALEILNKVYAADPGIFCVYCGLEDAYVLRNQYTGPNIDEMAKYYTHAQIVDHFEDVTDTCIKVALYDVTAHSKDRIEPLVKGYRGPQQVTLSSDYWLDIMNKDINKGVAVRAVEKKFHLRPDEVAVFGDYLNDLEMMSAAKYSFATANAHPDIKKAANYETASNDEAGVLKGIQWLIDEGLC